MPVSASTLFFWKDIPLTERPEGFQDHSPSVLLSTESD